MKLWNGRFTKESAELTDKFNSSISFDKRLYKHDIEGSIAHSDMLGKKAIIPKADSELIQKALKEILTDIELGKLAIDEHAEDIHMFIETILTERIGAAGKKLHTGRSRNDQVALDMRMYVKDEIKELRTLISALAITLIDLAESNIDTVLPGYTHLQRAQPVTLAHHLLAYVEMLKRDTERLADVYKRTDTMPLGSGALAATTYPLDRPYVSERLGFSDITYNSLDAVSDRDFCIELLGALSIMMMHLSRFCEEIILWASLEFGFIELDDAYSTGSSIMPQKKNPDIAELIRGKTGRVYGSLITLLTVMKALPLAYNKDMQEDKEAVFDAIDTAKACLPAFLGMVSSMKINKDTMLLAARNGFANATDAADYLVNKKGLPFRDAHEIIGKLVLYCVNNRKSLDELTLKEYRSFSSVFDESVFAAISLENCINSRKIEGGPAKEQTLKLILAGRKFFTK